MNYLKKVVAKDVKGLRKKDKAYRGSWKKRGGANAFFMLCRKWDRIEIFLEEKDWDIFEAIKNDKRKEKVLDDIRDLRRYLILVEAEMMACTERRNHHDAVKKTCDKINDRNKT